MLIKINFEDALVIPDALDKITLYRALNLMRHFAKLWTVSLNLCHQIRNQKKLPRTTWPNPFSLGM